MPEILQLRQQAEIYYREGQYYCSEAIFTVFNDYFGRPLPPEAVCLASAFPIGMGKAGCTCGALSGAMLILGLVFGRTAPGAEMPAMFEAARSLHNRFKATYGSTCCRQLTRGLELGTPQHKQHCVTITGQVAQWLGEMVLTKKPLFRG